MNSSAFEFGGSHCARGAPINLNSPLYRGSIWFFFNKCVFLIGKPLRIKSNARYVYRVERKACPWLSQINYKVAVSMHASAVLNDSETFLPFFKRTIRFLATYSFLKKFYLRE